jgi:hypothetical protein
MLIPVLPGGVAEMKTKFGVILAALGVLALVVPAFAHHSWPVEYDAKKPIKVQGVVSKVEWTNPAHHFYVDVKDDKGALPPGTSRWPALCARA